MASRYWLILSLFIASVGALFSLRPSDVPAALGPILVPGPGDHERGVAEVRRGRALREAGDPRGAVVAFDSAALMLPEVSDWVELLAVGAAADAGDTAQVRERLGRMEPAIASAFGWPERVRALRKAGDPAGALAAATAAARSVSGASARAKAWGTAAEITLESGDTAGAVPSLREALDASPGSSAARDAALALTKIPGRSAADRLAIGRVLVRHGRITPGVKALRAYLDAGAGSAAGRSSVRMSIGNALFSAGRYREAEREYRRIARGPAASSLAARALYDAARAQYRRGSESAARATLLRVAELFPEADAAGSALFLLGDLDQDEGRTTDASRLFRRVVADHGGGVDEVGKAYMRLGGIAFLGGDYEDAARIYEEYRKRFPGGERFQQATYWAARAYRELGRGDVATARLREIRRLGTLSYYAVRAADLLGEPIWSAPLGPEPATAAEVRAGVERGLERIDLLRELEIDDGVDYETDRLEDDFDANGPALYALAEGLNDRGFTATGITLGRRLERAEDGWNARLLRIVYPMPYRDIISAEARKHGLDPYLVAALIRQESSFQADARSGAGAIGLMQIMPGTGRTLARGAGISGFDNSMLVQPEVNIRLGTIFMADLLEQYRVPQMLAAYNAGPARVDRWRKLPEARDPELFAERIPYDETRGYVKIVQANARIYRALYPDLAGGAAGR